MADSYGGAEWAKSQDRNADTQAANMARFHVAEAIRALGDHPQAMMCPVYDWLVSLREVLVDMAQADGSDSVQKSRQIGADDA